ncbi:MAG: hypothetical protein AB7G28_15710 [Pirellulales bacterium]
MLLLAGCGTGLADVQGSVSIDGEKVVCAEDVRGTVLFSPREPGLPTGSGVLDESGQYAIYVGANEGLKPGPYSVAVTVTRIRPASTEGGTPSGELLSPARYANPKESGLEAEVKPGSNTFDFALETRRNAR